MKQRAPALPDSTTFQQLWDALGSRLVETAQGHMLYTQDNGHCMNIGMSDFLHILTHLKRTISLIINQKGQWFGGVGDDVIKHASVFIEGKSTGENIDSQQRPTVASYCVSSMISYGLRSLFYPVNESKNSGAHFQGPTCVVVSGYFFPWRVC